MQNAEVVFCLGVESYWLYRFLLLLLLFCGFFFSLNEEVTNWNNLYLIWDSLFAIVNLSQVTCFLKLLDQCSYNPLPGHLWNCEGVRNSYWVACKRCTVFKCHELCLCGRKRWDWRYHSVLVLLLKPCHISSLHWPEWCGERNVWNWGIRSPTDKVGSLSYRDRKLLFTALWLHTCDRW